jgi:hypothetical protein
MPSVVAEIVTVPAATPVTWPRRLRACVVLATNLFDDVQLHCVVRICVVLSLNVPVAVSWIVAPTATDGFAGVMAIETSVALVTVSVVEAVFPWKLAVISVVPAATPVASPCVPAELEIVAVAPTLEVQDATVVMSWVEPSLNKHVATNCSVVPFAICGLVGVSVIVLHVAFVTVSCVLPVEVPNAAVMVVVPVLLVVARPSKPGWFEIDAMFETLDDHVA